MKTTLDAYLAEKKQTRTEAQAEQRDAATAGAVRQMSRHEEAFWKPAAVSKGTIDAPPKTYPVTWTPQEQDKAGRLQQTFPLYAPAPELTESFAEWENRLRYHYVNMIDLTLTNEVRTQ